jgi:hypothetical protein
VSGAWILFALVFPPAASVTSAAAFRGREANHLAVIALNALMPGSGLAAAGRPSLEIVLGVLFAQASLLVTGGLENIEFLVPIAVIGGLWGSVHTSLNPIELAASSGRATYPTVREATSGPAITTRATTDSRDSDKLQPEDAGYSVLVRCTECGADVEVPVLARMARCSFCDSDHLVVGQEDTLYVTLPAKVNNEADLMSSVLDHYRYQHYLQLYRRTVAPLEQSSSEVGPGGQLATRPEVEAAAAAAEVAASKKADHYRAKLATRLSIGSTQRFLAPYRHGMGTLFQLAFGRSPNDQEKQLRFAIGTIEAAVLATDAADLPTMGKLSYLRALAPAAQCGEEVKTLSLDMGEEALQRAYGELDRKRLVRDLDVIRLGVKFSEDVTAVIWRPWWIADVEGPDIHETLLVDGAAATVAGAAPYLNPEVLEDLPEVARQPGAGLRFVPMECPTCGHEYPFDTDAALHFCTNCHRVCGVEDGRKYELDYAHQAAPDDGHDMVPFWRFPLRLRTGDGRILTDVMHLKDGIDGTLDQIGDDAPEQQHSLLAPAFRCINSKLMALAYERVFQYTVRHPPRLAGERFPLDARPRPWSVSLEEPEARNLLPLYIAHALGRRDIARVKVDQVANWLFDATQEAKGQLSFVPVPRQITEPFRRYVGRYRSRAVRDATTVDTS